MSDLLEQIFPSERDREIVRQAMMGWEMSAEATIRHFVRMGQMMDTLLKEADGDPIGYLDGQGDFHDPFYKGPKMAPMPPEHVDPFDVPDTWEGEGGAPVKEPVRSCNRHSNCEEAENEVLARNPGKKRADIHPTFHCHDDECEDCLGS
jgi:hypothetical protein